MTTEERMARIESRLETMAAENAAPKHEIQRLHEYNDIQRLMGEYMTCYIRTYREGILSQRNHFLFFANRPDSSAEIADHGVHVGYDHIRKMCKRDRPTTHHKMYGLTRELDPVPLCPEPYDTWADDRPCV